MLKPVLVLALIFFAEWSCAHAQTPVTINTTIAAGATGQVVPAPVNGNARNFATICNYAALNGSTLYCRSDGGTPAANLGVAVGSFASNQLCKTWYSTQVSSAAINCACVGLTSCPTSGEYAQ
jgi:hypothetical protein